MDEERSIYIKTVPLIKIMTKIETKIEFLGGEGKGIWEKADTVKKLLPLNIMPRIIEVAKVRNEIVHGNPNVDNIDNAVMKAQLILDDIEYRLAFNFLKKDIEIEIEKLDLESISFFEKIFSLKKILNENTLNEVVMILENKKDEIYFEINQNKLVLFLDELISINNNKTLFYRKITKLEQYFNTLDNQDKLLLTKIENLAEIRNEDISIEIIEILNNTEIAIYRENTQIRLDLFIDYIKPLYDNKILFTQKIDTIKELINNLENKGDTFFQKIENLEELHEKGTFNEIIKNLNSQELQINYPTSTLETSIHTLENIYQSKILFQKKIVEIEQKIDTLGGQGETLFEKINSLKDSLNQELIQKIIPLIKNKNDISYNEYNNKQFILFIEHLDDLSHLSREFLRKINKLEELIKNLGGSGSTIWRKIESVQNLLSDEIIKKLIYILDMNIEIKFGNLNISTIQKYSNAVEDDFIIIIQYLEETIKSADSVIKDIEDKKNKINELWLIYLESGKVKSISKNIKLWTLKVNKISTQSDNINNINKEDILFIYRNEKLFKKFKRIVIKEKIKIKIINYKMPILIILTLIIGSYFLYEKGLI